MPTLFGQPLTDRMPFVNEMVAGFGHTPAASARYSGIIVSCICIVKIHLLNVPQESALVLTEGMWHFAQMHVATEIL
jgi:hypothetical protein